MSNNLNKARINENLAWTTFIVSYFGQQLTQLFSKTPSGLESYIDNPKFDAGGLFLNMGGLAYAFISMHSSPGCYKEKGLVTTGMHSLSRNPIYSGFRLSALGTILVNPTIENILGCTAVLISTEVTARIEETKLRELYGEDFRRYQDKVPRWIPYANHIRNGAINAGKYLAGKLKNLKSSK